MAWTNVVQWTPRSTMEAYSLTCLASAAAVVRGPTSVPTCPRRSTCSSVCRTLRDRDGYALVGFF